MQLGAVFPITFTSRGSSRRSLLPKGGQSFSLFMGGRQVSRQKKKLGEDLGTLDQRRGGRRIFHGTQRRAERIRRASFSSAPSQTFKEKTASLGQEISWY